MRTLHALLGEYPNTLAMKSGQVQSMQLAFNFAGVKVPHHAFKQVVREQEFDVAELAIVTYLQAKAYGKPLVLLPAVVMVLPPHLCLACNVERAVLTPSDLAGRRVGIRAHSVTTVTWVRGILANDYGVDLDRVQWVTFEDPHVAEYRDPPTVTRAAPGKELLPMLLAGELDAAVVAPGDLRHPKLRSVIPDPADAMAAWCRRYGVLPLNHMVVVKESLSRSEPWAVEEVFRLLVESRQGAGLPAGVLSDALRFGVDSMRETLDLIIDYAAQQRLIPRRFTVDELFDDVTRSLGT